MAVLTPTPTISQLVKLKLKKGESDPGSWTCDSTWNTNIWKAEAGGLLRETLFENHPLTQEKR